jgi:hypothetical protein
MQVQTLDVQGLDDAGQSTVAAVLAVLVADDRHG